MAKNVLIKGLEFWYAKLDKPASPFGTEQWELLAAFDPSETDIKRDLEDAGVSVKQKTLKDNDVEYDRMVATLKRSRYDRKQNERDPVRVVDNMRQPMASDLIGKIGNRSKGNVILFSYDWEQMGKKGTSAMLTSVQVTELNKYEGSSGGDVDFDIEDGGSPSGSTGGADLDFG